MVQFPGSRFHRLFYSPMHVGDSTPTGYPIRSPPVLWMFAPPRGFSQLTTTFFARQLLGIHRRPFSRLTISSLHPSLSTAAPNPSRASSAPWPLSKTCLQTCFELPLRAARWLPIFLSPPKRWRYGDLNPRPMACKAIALAN